MDRETVKDNLELNIRWIEDNPAHQFPGWGNVTSAMRDALALLKEQEEAIPLEPLCKWLSYYAVCPTKTGSEPFHNIDMVRVGWEKWFRGGFQEWLRMGKEGVR